MAEKKIIVATSQPGLTEQLSRYPLKVVYDGRKSEDISTAFTDALEIYAAADNFDVDAFIDQSIPFPVVIDAIESRLKKGA